MYKTCSRCGKIHETSYKCFKGLNNDPEKRLRNTSRWKKKRAEIKEASKYICAVCYDRDRYYNHRGLEIHHITKLRHAPELLTDNLNLIALCPEHHKQADAGEIDKDYLLKLAQEREDNPPL